MLVTVVEEEGNVEATGEDFTVEPAETRRPFRALLDVGLIRTTTGNRVFGVLKVSGTLSYLWVLIQVVLIGFLCPSLIKVVESFDHNTNILTCLKLDKYLSHDYDTRKIYKHNTNIRISLLIIMLAN